MNNLTNSDQPPDLYRTLQAARGALLPAVESAALPECLLALFFLKYLSDLARQVPRGLLNFKLPPEADFAQLLHARKSPGNGERIDLALKVTVRANAGQFEGLFTDPLFMRPRGLDSLNHNKLIARVLKIVGVRLDFSVHDGSQRMAALATLLESYALDTHSSTESLYTPQEIAALIVQLLEPKTGEKIYDPVCGTGSLLLDFGETIRRQHDSRDYMLWGQDLSPKACALARLLAFFHGETQLNITCGDTLRLPVFPKDRKAIDRYFDIVAGSPPFSVSNWGWESAPLDPWCRFRRGIPPRTRADYAFILHMIESLKPDTGRMAVVSSQGVLFRGESEADIRQNLIDGRLLHSVIGLPPKLFFNSSIAAVLLIFRAKPVDTGILFIDASRDFGSGTSRNRLRSEDIDRIVTVHKERTTILGYSHLATYDEIASKRFNLNLATYVRSERDETLVDPVQLNQRIRDLQAEHGLVSRQLEHALEQLMTTRKS